MICSICNRERSLVLWQSSDVMQTSLITDSHYYDSQKFEDWQIGVDVQSSSFDQFGFELV